MAARTLTFPTRGHAQLDGALVGAGPTGVVLLPEYPGSYCGWWPYAVDFARHGLHVLLFDYHCQGLSSCGRDRLGYVGDVAAAAAVLKAHGARSVALVGASLGGTIALAAAARLHPAAVVDLSGEADSATIIAARLASRVRTPAFFAVARRDRYVSVRAMTAVYRGERSHAKTLRVLPHAAGHGWDMLATPDGTFRPLVHQIITFVTQHAPQPSPVRRTRYVDHKGTEPQCSNHTARPEGGQDAGLQSETISITGSTLPGAEPTTEREMPQDGLPASGSHPHKLVRSPVRLKPVVQQAKRHAGPSQLRLLRSRTSRSLVG